MSKYKCKICGYIYDEDVMDTPFNELNEYVFYSISSDGKVVRWSFFKNKTTLETEEVITLPLV